MFINLDRTETELLALALRYWRSQRCNSTMRRHDPLGGPNEIDLLLAKLGVRSPGRSSDWDDPFDELPQR